MEKASPVLGLHEDLNAPIKNRPGARVVKIDGIPPFWESPNPAGLNMVRSWNPISGPFLGNLIPHDETFSISKYLGNRPTCFFAYQPAADAIESQRDWLARDPEPPGSYRLMLNDIVSGGQDILGVLLCRKGRADSLWYGSLLSVDEARARLPGSSATTISVISNALAGLAWVLKNPNAGFCEPDDIDYSFALPLVLPYSVFHLDSAGTRCHRGHVEIEGSAGGCRVISKKPPIVFSVSVLILRFPPSQSGRPADKYSKITIRIGGSSPRRPKKSGE